MKNSKLISIQEVQSIINELEEINPNEPNAFNQAIATFSSMNKLPGFIYDLPSGMPVFRARTHRDYGFFHHLSDYGMPPKETLECYGRCNPPYEPVFYCSENRPVAYMELVLSWAAKLKDGDKFAVTTSRWVLKEELPSIIIASPDINERKSEYDIIHGESLDRFIEAQHHYDRDALRLFFSFLARKFRTMENLEHTYIITSAYTRLLLDRSEGQASAICYPSVRFGGSGINIAINADYLNNKDNLVLTDAIRNVLVRGTNDSGQVEFTEIEMISAKKVDGENKLVCW